ncbi:lectin C-type domain protein [Ancylostoma ceylanicum]|uniref:Lectin C-type domain protein n=2 Tax=Ancylostoma ceylanicum TaxID=53326 RepID=A0A0D6MAV1_9BILA|nr:lectin C-type domain protein [Ancylostoma ceylanicum]
MFQPATFFELPSEALPDTSLIVLASLKSENVDRREIEEMTTVREKMDDLWLVVTIMIVLFATSEGYLRTQCDRSTTNWERLDDYEYKVFCLSSYISFAAAERQCKFYDAHLVSIHSMKENDFVHELIGPKLDRLIYSWIGLYRDDVGADWKWTDGSEVDFINWGFHQPDNYNNRPGFGPENCAHMYVVPRLVWDTYWNDVECDKGGNLFVCKRMIDDDRLEVDPKQITIYR